MTRLAIAFVGQCHTAGYEGVPADVAFPNVCRDAVQASRPETHVEVILKPYYHPSELVAAVRSVLRKQPRVVVIEVVGWLSVSGTTAVDLAHLPRGVRSAYERLRLFRHLSQNIPMRLPAGADLIYRVQTNAVALSRGVLRALLPRYPRASVADYESCVTEALQLVEGAPETSAVVQGPGAPNLALDRLPADAIERYRAVNAMARRVAFVSGALYVDRWDTVAGGFYTPGSVKPTAGAHSLWGQLLASELLAAGVV